MSSDRQGTAYVAQIPHQVPQSHYYQQNPNMMPPHNPPILSMNPQHQRQISAGLAVPPLVQSSSQSASYNQGQLPSNSISQVSYENTSSHMTMPQTPHMSLPQISQMPTAQTFNMPPSSHMKTAHISTSYIPAAQVPQMSVAQPYHLPAASHAPLAPMTTSYVSAPINTPLSNNSYSSSEAYSSSGLSIITLPSMPLALYEPPQYMSQMNPVLDKYYRPTMQVLPNQPSILSKMKVPLGVTITPFLDSELFSNENVGVLRVPVVGGSIQRCRKCRAYINPYVEWYDSGSRYKCNLCFFVNDIPSDYDFDARTQKSIPRKERAELFEPVVEFMAPAEYMVRAPQANIFFFILDVSYGAISNGILPVLARTLLSGLDNLPNSDGRTKVGFCLVDDSVTFVSFNLAMNEPQLLVIPRDEDSEKDSSGPFLPRPEDLLVNLTDSRYQLESFLTKLPTLYYNRTSARQPIVGTALLSAHKLLGPIGGKIVVFLSTLPGLDKGELKFRDEASLIGTEKVTNVCIVGLFLLCFLGIFLVATQ